MGFIGTMDLIIVLLKDIDNNNPKDVLTSIKIFSDGSGSIYQKGEEIPHSDFNTTHQAVFNLQNILDECINQKK